MLSLRVLNEVRDPIEDVLLRKYQEKKGDTWHLKQVMDKALIYQPTHAKFEVLEASWGKEEMTTPPPTCELKPLLEVIMDQARPSFCQKKVTSLGPKLQAGPCGVKPEPEIPPPKPAYLGRAKRYFRAIFGSRLKFSLFSNICVARGPIFLPKNRFEPEPRAKISCTKLILSDLSHTDHL